jgi:acetoin:2,6-dichlorophenolindophenol oxidoreductase subunit alpha
VTTGVDTALALHLHEQMVFIRRFEAKVDALYRQGRVRGPAHLGIGQEAVAVGAASVLRPGDRSIGTYRGHAHALARGAPPGAVLRELLGRAGGICAGKGGSMHITSVEHGYYGSYAIIGAHLPIACGLGWADQIRGDDAVTLCFFGDGTTNIGAFHEALNLAAVWSLPVVFVCENNHYMEYTPIADVIAVKQPAADRAAAYGLAPLCVDGNDVDAVRAVVGAAVDRARNGGGPSLVEAETYRHGGHSAADPATYRSTEEVAQWKLRDPLLRHAEQRRAAGVSDADIEVVTSGVAAEIERITMEALAAPSPPADTAWTDMWSDGSSRWRN